MSEEFDKIIEVAKYQNGYIATYQLDVTPQLLKHHEKQGRIERIRRGIYRVTQYPREENEEFIVGYLWSKERGTLSHQTALAIHDLSDVLPKKVHLTLPSDEKPVRRQVPEWLQVHFDDIPDDEKQWHDIVRVTQPERTLVDVAVDKLDIDQLKQAVEDAKRHGYVGQEFEWKLIRKIQERCF